MIYANHNNWITGITSKGNMAHTQCGAGKQKECQRWRNDMQTENSKNNTHTLTHFKYHKD